MARERVSGIYAFVNRESDTWYVGSSSHVAKRFVEHLRFLRSGRHKNARLQADWLALGEAAFELRLLEVVAGEDALVQRERVWLIACAKTYNVRRPKRNDLSSSAAQAAKIGPRQSGRMLSDQWRANISAAKRGKSVHTPEHRQSLRDRMLGKQLPAEWRQAISDGRKGQSQGPFSETARARMSAAHKGRRRKP